MKKNNRILTIEKQNYYLFFKGRVALYAILDAMDVGEDDEVILPAYTCVVVPNAILYRGAKPVYVDICLDNFSVNPKDIEALITAKTKVVICQNTYGLSANVDVIVDLCRRHGIATIEDCTHGFGGTYNSKPNGTWCDAAFFSSQWNKPFSTGVGGYALLNNKDLEGKVAAFATQLPLPSIKTAVMLKALMLVRKLISPSTYYMFVNAYRYLSKHNLVTGSSTGEELEGIKMPTDYLLGMTGTQRKAAVRALYRLPAINESRKRAAMSYTEILIKLGKNHVPYEQHSNHLFLKYPVLVENREAFINLGRTAKIPLGDWFRSPLHPIEGDLSQWFFDEKQFPNACFAAQHVVNLPTDVMNVDHIIDFIKKNASLILSAGRE